MFTNIVFLEGNRMNTSKLLIAATACGFFALLAACGGSASNDAAGTLMEAKRATTGTPAPAAAPVAAADADAAKAAEEAAKAGAEGDAASAATAAGGPSGNKDGNRDGNRDGSR